MKNLLAIYLQDHQAGAQMAVKLVRGLQKQNQGSSLERFAATLLTDIQEDVTSLRQVIDQIGEEPSKGMKRTISWVAEKGSWLKLHRRSNQGLGTFEALEALSLGILGKHALWRALAHLEPFDRRLSGVDYARLLKRAKDQHDRVEKRRLKAAQEVLKHED